MKLRLILIVILYLTFLMMCGSSNDGQENTDNNKVTSTYQYKSLPTPINGHIYTKTANSRVFIRQVPSTTTKSESFKVNSKTKLDVLEMTTSQIYETKAKAKAHWFKVKITSGQQSGKTGWVFGNFVRYGHPDQFKQISVKNVGKSRLMVRESPDLKGKIIEKIPNGTILALLEKKGTNNWYKVRTRTAQIGYCNGKFLNFGIVKETKIKGVYLKKIQKLIIEYQNARIGLSRLIKQYDKGKFKENLDAFESRWNAHYEIRADILVQLEKLRIKAEGKAIKYHDKFIDIVNSAIKTMSKMDQSEKNIMETLLDFRKKLKSDSKRISNLFKEVKAFYAAK